MNMVISYGQGEDIRQFWRRDITNLWADLAPGSLQTCVPETPLSGGPGLTTCSSLTSYSLEWIFLPVSSISAISSGVKSRTFSSAAILRMLLSLVEVVIAQTPLFIVQISRTPASSTS